MFKTSYSQQAQLPSLYNQGCCWNDLNIKKTLKQEDGSVFSSSLTGILQLPLLHSQPLICWCHVILNPWAVELVYSASKLIIDGKNVILFRIHTSGIWHSVTQHFLMYQRNIVLSSSRVKEPFKMSATTNPATQCHILKTWILNYTVVETSDLACHFVHLTQESLIVFMLYCCH
jgi:hypothetical protein